MNPTVHPPPPARSFARKLLLAVAGLLLTYFVIAYIVLPLLWRADTRRQSVLWTAPRITHTANGIPGDPVNLALVGSEEAVIRALTAAKWFAADPITLRSSVRIAVDSVFRRPDDAAPVSSLFLFGRKQDLAFEQPLGDSPRQRHHVRFWRWDREEAGRPVWFGSATFDERVGLSHETGQITHHIGPDVDAERDRLAAGLQQADRTEQVYWIKGFHAELQGKNGGGDPWRTDGRLEVVVLKPLTKFSPALTNLPAGR